MPRTNIRHRLIFGFLLNFPRVEPFRRNWAPLSTRLNLFMMFAFDVSIGFRLAGRILSVFFYYYFFFRMYVSVFMCIEVICRKIYCMVIFKPNCSAVAFNLVD